MESWKPQEGIPRRSGNGPYAWSSTTARSTSLNGPQCALSHLSYDNALAESVIGLYKTELIRGQGPWKTLQDVEFATLEWVDWFNHRRLFESIGNIPPAEREEIYYTTLTEEEEEGHGANESPVNPGRFIAPPQRRLTKQGLLQRGGEGGCLGGSGRTRQAPGKPEKDPRKCCTVCTTSSRRDLFAKRWGIWWRVGSSCCRAAVSGRMSWP